MDNLVMEKVWIDSNPVEDFFAINVTANNDRVSMSSCVYAQSPSISALQQGIKDLPARPFTVDLGCDDNNYVKLRFSANKRGNITISIAMKSGYHEYGSDTANFSITTDIASLDRFSTELDRIIKEDVGTRIQLHS